MAKGSHGDARERILEAAEERLWYYGFKKTTIDEIAADAGVGKGTVYLHFESKEEITLAIIAKFKKASNERAREIARDPTLAPAEKLARMLIHPVVIAHERCSQSPAALEIVAAVKPYIKTRMGAYLDEEIALLASVLAEGNETGLFDAPDPLRVARTLKYATTGFLPPYPCVADVAEIQTEIERVVDLVVYGLLRRTVATG